MSWLPSPIAAALARALFHFVWEGAVIAALLGLMLLVLRRAPASARYSAACAAMLAMAASFAVTLAGPGRAAAHFPLPAFAGFVAEPSLPHSPAAPATAHWGTWAVGAWLAGVLVLLVRRSNSWRAARRLLTRAAVAADEPWGALVNRLARRMGIGRAVALLESALVETPAVIGWLRPAILVPAGWFLGLPADQAETILLHELAHIRRHDYLVNLLQNMVEDLLFYHPAVWWVGRVIRRERENCCDDAVISLGGDPRAYARTLAALEGLRAGEPVLAATGGSLAARIRRLLRPAEGPRASAAPLVLVLALVCAGAVTLPAWQRPAAPVSPPAPKPAAAPPAKPVPSPARKAALQAELQTPYRKWLDEDVLYIIHPEERAAFERLRTNEEKEHFIEQFWARRGTPFKEEHYRRIAHANELFAEGQPGWKSDRGRAYIVYGPPDEKEVHPAPAAGPAEEDWLWRRSGQKDLTMRFVDGNGSGVYRLAVPSGRLQGFVPMLPPPVPVTPPAVLPQTPNVQANGDYLFQSGDTSVRVGVDGATLITVAAGEVRVTLTRITGQDGSGEVVLQESARVPGVGYTKLLTLRRGMYRLDVVADQSMSEATRLLNLQTRDAALRSELASARETYQDSHPRVRAAQAEAVALEAQLQRVLVQQQMALRLQRQRQTAHLAFRVP